MMAEIIKRLISKHLMPAIKEIFIEDGPQEGSRVICFCYCRVEPHASELGGINISGTSLPVHVTSVI
jgi:hypothetical protein